MEIWKPIEETGGLYEVSNTGKIRSHHYGKTKVLKCGIMADGYVNALLHFGGMKASRKVHRLVAQAFIPNPEGLPYVNHKDENPLNNHADNLEWCTQKYNVNYGTARQRHSRPVVQSTKNGERVAEYFGISEASRRTGVSKSHIVDCCCGSRPTAGGYRWSWAESEEKIFSKK